MSKSVDGSAVPPYGGAPAAQQAGYPTAQYAPGGAPQQYTSPQAYSPAQPTGGTPAYATYVQPQPMPQQQYVQPQYVQAPPHQHVYVVGNGINGEQQFVVVNPNQQTVVVADPAFVDDYACALFGLFFSFIPIVGTNQRDPVLYYFVLQSLAFLRYAPTYVYALSC